MTGIKSALAEKANRKEMDTLNRKIDDLESRSKRNNVVVLGLKDGAKKDRSSVEEFLQDEPFSKHMCLENTEVMRAHRTKINQNIEVMRAYRTKINQNIEVMRAHRTKINQNTEVMRAHRTKINQNIEVMRAHRTKINQNTEVMRAHCTKINQNIEAMRAHRTKINQNTEVMRAHRTKINQAASSASAPQPRPILVYRGTNFQGCDEHAER